MSSSEHQTGVLGSLLGSLRRPECSCSGLGSRRDWGVRFSRSTIREGGYEARSRPWKDALEERIIAKVHELFGKVNKAK